MTQRQAEVLAKMRDGERLIVQRGKATIGTVNIAARTVEPFLARGFVIHVPAPTTAGTVYRISTEGIGALLTHEHNHRTFKELAGEHALERSLGLNNGWWAAMKHGGPVHYWAAIDHLDTAMAQRLCGDGKGYNGWRWYSMTDIGVQRDPATVKRVCKSCRALLNADVA
jgi:hypothetical protein